LCTGLGFIPLVISCVQIFFGWRTGALRGGLQATDGRLELGLIIASPSDGLSLRSVCFFTQIFQGQLCFLAVPATAPPHLAYLHYSRYIWHARPLFSPSTKKRRQSNKAARISPSISYLHLLFSLFLHLMCLMTRGWKDGEDMDVAYGHDTLACSRSSYWNMLSLMSFWLCMDGNVFLERKQQCLLI